MITAQDVNILFEYQFGGRGTGNGEFQYPAGIVAVNGSLYIVDKQNHRIKQHAFDGSFISEFGTKGSGNDNFYFPESFIILSGSLTAPD